MVPDTKKTASHFIINYVKANFWILIKEELHILTKVTWLLRFLTYLMCDRPCSNIGYTGANINSMVSFIMKNSTWKKECTGPICDE